MIVKFVQSYVKYRTFLTYSSKKALLPEHQSEIYIFFTHINITFTQKAVIFEIKTSDFSAHPCPEEKVEHNMTQIICIYFQLTRMVISIDLSKSGKNQPVH